MKSNEINQFLIDELKEGGLGNDIIKEANSYGGQVEVKSFVIWLYIELQGLKIIHGLLNDFKKVEILEHYSDYFKLKVAKEGKSIGYMFGMIE